MTADAVQVAFYDAKPYDREYFAANSSPAVKISYHDFRLNADSAVTAKGAQAVCVFVSDQLDRACLETLKAVGVRHVALRCAGFNNVDTAAAKALGIGVSRVPAYSQHAVAEHALALLLTLNRKIHRAHNRVRELNFSLAGLVGFDLYGKTAGVVGTGKIGQITAEILKGFGMKVLAYDVHPDAAWAQRAGVEYVKLAQLWARSDVVSLHVPLNAQTHHMINAQAISEMKDGVYMINTSRGKLVDTAALIDGLKKGKFGGVGLDVYEEEEGVFYEDLSSQMLQDDELSRLLTFPNVLITSHQAFLTHEALTEISKVTTENLRRLSVKQELIKETAVG